MISTATPSTSKAVAIAWPTVISLPPSAARTRAIQPRTGLRAPRPGPRTVGGESPPRARSKRWWRACPQPRAPQARRRRWQTCTLPRRGRSRPSARSRRSPTRSSQLQHVDVVAVAVAAELMDEQQVVVGVDSDDDRVRRQRADDLGQRVAAAIVLAWA